MPGSYCETVIALKIMVLGILDYNKFFNFTIMRIVYVLSTYLIRIIYAYFDFSYCSRIISVNLSRLIQSLYSLNL